MIWIKRQLKSIKRLRNDKIKIFLVIKRLKKSKIENWKKRTNLEVSNRILNLNSK